MNITSIIKEHKLLLLFLLKFGGILLIWQICYLTFLEKGFLDIFITELVAKISVSILKLFSLDLSLIQDQSGAQVLLYNSKSLLKIAHNCNGLILYILFGAFVINFKGEWRFKLPFVLIGIIILLFVNSLRVAALILTEIYNPAFTDFSHKYLYTFIVYAVELGLWMLWINRFSEKKTD
jgi:exosortase family protein XrtF